MHWSDWVGALASHWHWPELGFRSDLASLRIFLSRVRALFRPISNVIDMIFEAVGALGLARLGGFSGRQTEPQVARPK